MVEALIGQTCERLKAELAQQSQQTRFELLQPALLGGELAGGYAQAGQVLGMDEGAVKVAVHRLRKRFGQLLRATLAESLADPAEVEAELRYLFGALKR